MFYEAYKSLYENPELQQKMWPAFDMLIDSDSDDEDEGDVRSIASTPANSGKQTPGIPHKRSSSFTTFDDVERKKHYVPTATVTSERVNLDLNCLKKTKILKKDHHQLSPTVFHHRNVDRVTVPSPPPTPPEVIEKGRLLGLPPIRRPQTPDRDFRKSSHSRSPSDHSRKSLKAPSLFSLSPITKAFLESSGQLKRSVLPHKYSVNTHYFGHHKRKSSSDISEDLHESGDTLGGDTFSQKIRLTFEAPRKGQLGLLLEPDDSGSGLMVGAVKDYSPLLGLVEKGDRLIEIDGKNISQSSVAEVTKILKANQSPYRSGGNLRIVVSRVPADKTSAPILPRLDGASSWKKPDPKDHKRGNSYGGGRTTSSRLSIDVDDDALSI
jgi:hypothetical protein